MDDEGSLTPETGKIKRPVEVLPQAPPLGQFIHSLRVDGKGDH